ncbi:MAG: GatB/YqeY domain-containing protein [Salinivirgaceae bacterium]|jgi:uncharacterized protein YqeY|nr:GatB/YqeY domain-containing protein [Salinivirgaceae bacterium]
MSLSDKINADIKSAMLAKEKEKLEALRSVKAAFMLAKTEKGSSDVLSEEAELKIVQKLVKQRKDSAEVYKTNDRQELYEKEISEAQIIQQYLPAQMTEEKVAEAIKAIVLEVGALGPQDMGKVMGVASKRLGGKAEGRIIAQKVKEILASL